MNIYLSHKNRVTLKLRRRVVDKDDITSPYFNEHWSKILGFRDLNKVLGLQKRFIHMKLNVHQTSMLIPLKV